VLCKFSAAIEIMVKAYSASRALLIVLQQMLPNVCVCVWVEVQSVNTLQ
jgi:hypothetical protein